MNNSYSPTRRKFLSACALASVAATRCFQIGLIAAEAQQPNVDYAPGQKAPAFEVKTTDGKTVKFPEDFKGKVVLIDFWATWCGPCKVELPNVTAAYQQFHSQGLEILGISLDHKDAKDKLEAFRKDKNMPWPQIYDGKFWKAALVVQYGVRGIPMPLLVDGDSGIILAEAYELEDRNSLRLSKTRWLQKRGIRHVLNRNVGHKTHWSRRDFKNLLRDTVAMVRLFYSLLVVILLEVAAAFTHAEEVSLGA